MRPWGYSQRSLLSVDQPVARCSLVTIWKLSDDEAIPSLSLLAWVVTLWVGRLGRSLWVGRFVSVAIGPMLCVGCFKSVNMGWSL